MLNEFGVPMNDAEMNMMPGSPGKIHLERELASSGLEMRMDPGTTAVIVGAGISAIGSFFGGKKASDAAKEQAEMQNAAAQRRLSYDNELYDMMAYKIRADRDHAVKVVETQARNEGRTAAWKDAVNLQRYNYDMMIRNREQSSLNQQYLRSDSIYNEQLSLNARSARTADRNELRKADEIRAEAAFNAQDAQIKALIEEGKIRASGPIGRSGKKSLGARAADIGRQYSAMSQSLDFADENMRSVLKEIIQDRDSADLAALAQKMLDPGVLPTPIVPFKTPMADFIYPREIIPQDYGPRPVLGAYASPSAAANQVWGSTIAGIAGNIGTMVAAHDWG